MVRPPSGRDLPQLVFAEQVAIVYGLTPFTLDTPLSELQLCIKSPPYVR